ncbi:MAG: RNA-binding protein [Candidatus Verstraetearchaeota archaeon]|jgi:small nuclear ribonucleoprotein|uniref:Putative snRNP Sm-like protein n=1 Tax=Thermoproteota archaeon TaxID=2056631 RepID=A0A523BB15_9CREN|nr:RNA-binding protein [Candidatus Methanomethylicales archaeon]MCQ5363262.1 LSm family protein [Candidatus Methanomethylicia archaeon]NHV60597.1 RNA-binding protein [Candidatus Verstraetearchaeota archaeon]TDA38054.1 MAG: RNA-binding protein [Candidatus Verstraetearchaeota archaeon]
MSEYGATEMLTESLGSFVLVKLKGGREVRGLMKSFDQHLNLVLENAEELMQDREPKKLGTIIVRGDNVVIVSPSPR